MQALGLQCVRGPGALEFDAQRRRMARGDEPKQHEWATAKLGIDTRANKTAQADE